MSYSQAPKYELSVGIACSSKDKSDVSGDNYSILKLNDNRVLIAICDGSGHGKVARSISEVALNLIENFYKTGFSSETVVSSVNKILLPAGEENFTTLDACVFNKNDGTVDFIKIGASVSAIKSSNTSRLIEPDSLPMGIIENIKFSTKRTILKNKDIVILTSDGIVDSFYSPEEYLNFINNEKVVNVQMFANNILEEAESRTGVHDDDKTVLIVKVSLKV